MNNSYQTPYQTPMEDTMDPALSFIAGLVIGGLIGAGAMLVLAPQSGKKTRGQIQKESIKLRNQTTDAVEDVVSQTGDKARQISSDISKQAKELEHRGEKLIKEQLKH